MTYQYQRWEHSNNWSVADAITAERLQDINQELDELFKRMDSRNLSISLDIQNRVTQVVDNTNSITLNIDRAWASSDPQFFTIQEVWDTSKFTITYWNGDYLSSIVYA